MIKLTYSRVRADFFGGVTRKQSKSEGDFCGVRSLIPPSSQQNEKLHGLLAYVCPYACTLMADDTRERGSECDGAVASTSLCSL